MDMGSYFRMIKKRKIPSKDDFKRASLNAKHRSRGVSQVREKILDRYQKSGVIHEFFLQNCSDSSDYHFRANIFYPSEDILHKENHSIVESEIKYAVIEELNIVRSETYVLSDIIFEFDSHENVILRYEGDYFNRLR